MEINETFLSIYNIQIVEYSTINKKIIKIDYDWKS